MSLSAPRLDSPDNPPLGFTPRLPPMPHQEAFLRDHGADTAYALFWEQGTGKTKGLIDNVAQLVAADRLDQVLVLAPSGVHRNWHVEEIPKHWPADLSPVMSFAWDGVRAASQAHTRAFAAFLDATDPRRDRAQIGFLCVSYDSLMTESGRAASWQFMRRGRTAALADESQRFKTPDAARTKRVLALGAQTDYRRIASGTPMETPMDVYSQVRFLDPDFWAREFSIGSYAAFKAHFGEWINATTNAGRTFPMLRKYRELDALTRALRRVGSRVEKEDVLTLLPKSWKRVYHQMAPRQTDLYEELRQECLAWLDSGELVTAEKGLVLSLRLAQVAAGFITPEAGAAPVPLDPNPREALLAEVLQDARGPVLVWHLWRADEAPISRACRKAGRRAYFYRELGATLDPWRADPTGVLVGNMSGGLAEGWTLNEASTAVYFTRSPRTIARQQSEDRIHRIGQTRAVTYIDLLAEKTLDTRQLDNTRLKRGFTGEVLGDSPTRVAGWLRELWE